MLELIEILVEGLVLNEQRTPLLPTYTPVSYTHLDVYKRQAKGRSSVCKN